MTDLVEHIRTVHFTVLVTALILTAALQIEKRRPLERAATDAEAILLLSQRWEQTESAVDREVLRGLAPASSPEFSQRLPLVGIYNAEATNKTPAIPFRLIVLRRWVYVSETELLGKFAVQGFGQWRTLRDFLRFWDGIHDRKAGFLPLLLDTDNNSSCRIHAMAREQDGYSSELLTLGFSADSRGTNWYIQPYAQDLTEPAVPLSGHVKSVCQFGHIESSPFEPGLALAFVQVTHQAEHWGTGDSKAEFPELIEASKHLEDTPLANLAAALRDRANQETDRIELFQAKLPASAIPTYGSLILIFCQVYLLAHLIEFRRLLSATKLTEPPTGYIGLYQNQLVHIFTIVSLVFFPIVPLMLEAFHNKEQLRFIPVAALLTSLSLGVFCSLVLITVRKQLLERPAAEEETD